MRCPIIVGRDEPAALIAGAVAALSGQAGLDARPAVYPVEQIITQDGTRSS